jgi:hypothetical protein
MCRDLINKTSTSHTITSKQGPNGAYNGPNGGTFQPQMICDPQRITTDCIFDGAATNSQSDQGAVTTCNCAANTCTGDDTAGACVRVCVCIYTFNMQWWTFNCHTRRVTPKYQLAHHIMVHGVIIQGVQLTRAYVDCAHLFKMIKDKAMIPHWMQLSSCVAVSRDYFLFCNYSFLSIFLKLLNDYVAYALL